MNENNIPLRKLKSCFVCPETENLQLAHMISHRMAKAIIERQFNEALTEYQHRRLHDAIYKIRNKKGDVWLCRKHHEISDEKQKEMADELERGVTK